MMKRFLNVQFILCFIFISCIERFEVPLDIGSQNTSEFGAGDTTFLELSPRWDSSYGLNKT